MKNLTKSSLIFFLLHALIPFTCKSTDMLSYLNPMRLMYKCVNNMPTYLVTYPCEKSAALICWAWMSITVTNPTKKEIISCRETINQSTIKRATKLKHDIETTRKQLSNLIVQNKQQEEKSVELKKLATHADISCKENAAFFNKKSALIQNRQIDLKKTLMFLRNKINENHQITLLNQTEFNQKANNIAYELNEKNKQIQQMQETQNTLITGNKILKNENKVLKAKTKELELENTLIKCPLTAGILVPVFKHRDKFIQ